MSQLLDLLATGSAYARLSDVRKQSNTSTTVRQQVAVNFFGNLTTDRKEITIEDAKVQKEFTVDEATNALSTTGISKAVADNNTKFTDNAGGAYGALGNYAKLSTDPKLKYINGDTSKLVQKYVSPDSTDTPNSSYKQKNSGAPGIVLVYPSP